MSRRGDEPAALAETLRLLHDMGFHRWAGMTAPERAADGSVSVSLKVEGQTVMPFGGLHGGVLTGLYEFPALAACCPIWRRTNGR